MPYTEDQIRSLVAQKRALKALHLADALQRAGASADDARVLNDAGWHNAERAARVRVASKATRDIAVAILERRETVGREAAEDYERELLAQ